MAGILSLSTTQPTFERAVAVEAAQAYLITPPEGNFHHHALRSGGESCELGTCKIKRTKEILLRAISAQ